MSTDPDLSGRRVVVTGASRGLGEALARRAAAAGASVALCATTEEAVRAVAESIRSVGGDAEAWRVDVGKWEEVRRFADAVEERWGEVHGLVNNASALGSLTGLGEYPVDEWEAVIRVNLTGCFHTIRAFLPLLRRSGRGSVIGVSSGVTAAPRGGWGAYAVSKWGTDAMTLNLAEEEAERGVRANVVDPGSMRTEMRRKAYPEEDPESLPPPEGSVPVFLWLLSDASRGVTGRRLVAREWSPEEWGG